MILAFARPFSIWWIAARFALVLVGVLSAVFYAIYWQAAIALWTSRGGLMGLEAVPLPLQILTLSVIESVLALAFWGASIYVVARRPDSWLVLLAAAVGFMTPVRVAFMQVVPTEALPAWFQPAAQTTFLTAYALLAYVTLAVFPDGVVRPRWVYWLLFARVLIIANFVANWVPLLNQHFVFVNIAMFSALMAAHVQRFRQESCSLVRQQTKWVLLGVGVGLSFFFAQRLADQYLIHAVPELYPIIYVASRGAILTIPVAVTFALLRYRLYDVDWVLNRGLVYSALSVFVVAVFGMGLVVSQVVLARLIDTADARLIMAVLSALCVAALHMPVRVRLQRWVDQRVFRLRVTPEALSCAATQPAAQPSWLGLQLGDLVLEKMVARGSMGEVYVATYRGRRVAVKLLPRESLDDRDVCRLIERELRLLQGLKHPNICQMLGFGLYEGVPYIVMEYVKGQELENVLKARGTLTLEEARLILRDIAAALDYLHEHNILHRDVKPRNIILQDLRAVLTDFGMARHIVGTQGTGTNLLTTPDYAAPEQLRGDHNVTPATDIYALGVVAYRMLTGQKPFTGTLQQKMLAILHTPARDPRELNPALPGATARAILQALEKDPTRRFSTAGEFARAV